MSNFALSDLLDVMDSQLNIEKSASESTAPEGQTKTASEAAPATDGITKMITPSEAGAALFDEIMKTASLNIEVGINKQASVAGAALAQALLKSQEKKASAGDVITADGVAPGSTSTKSTVDNAAMNAEGDAAVKPLPTGNGVENSGSVNEIFDAVVADAQSQGAASADQVHTTGVSANEGKVEDHATPNQVKTAEKINMEKLAAIQELVANGIAFSDAVDMVKQAEAEIAFEMEKAAAMAELMAEGIDFDSAVELVKEASSGDMITADGVAPGSTPTKAIVDNAAMNAEGDATIKPLPTGNGVENSGTVNEIFDALVADTLAQGAASADQVHTTGVSAAEGKVEDHATPSQVKVAYINKLLDAGVDFEDAVALVKEAGIMGEVGNIVGKMGRMAGRDAKAAVMGTKGAVKGVNGQFLKGGRGEAVKRLAKNPLAVGGAAAAGVGASAAIAAGREKKAAEAVGMLVGRGIAFEDAVSAVKEKATELYGA